MFDIIRKYFKSRRLSYRQALADRDAVSRMAGGIETIGAALHGWLKAPGTQTTSTRSAGLRGPAVSSRTGE